MGMENGVDIGCGSWGCGLGRGEQAGRGKTVIENNNNNKKEWLSVKRN